jgi:hypothetical protein
MPGAVRRCTCILWLGKAWEKTPRGVIPTVCVKYRRTLQEKRKVGGRLFRFVSGYNIAERLMKNKCCSYREYNFAFLLLLPCLAPIYLPNPCKIGRTAGARKTN